jgi:hypothetical protein
MLSREATNITGNCVIFDFTHNLEATFNHTRGKHAYHYTTNVLDQDEYQPHDMDEKVRKCVLK